MSVTNPQLLLKLSKNKFYKLTKAEQAILDDFLAKSSGSDTTSSPKTKSRKRAKTTPATVSTTPDETPTFTRNYFERETGEIPEEDVVNLRDDDNAGK